VFNLGTAAPLSDTDTGIYLNVGYYDGNSTSSSAATSSPARASSARRRRRPSSTRRRHPVGLGEEQFFALILTPDQPGVGVRTERVKLNPMLPPEDRSGYGVTATRNSTSSRWRPAPARLRAKLTRRPKEYKRLANSDVFKHQRKRGDAVQHLPGKLFFSSFFAPLLLTIMTWVHSLVPSWAWPSSSPP